MRSLKKILSLISVLSMAAPFVNANEDSSELNYNKPLTIKSLSVINYLLKAGVLTQKPNSDEITLDVQKLEEVDALNGINLQDLLLQNNISIETKDIVAASRCRSARTK